MEALTALLQSVMNVNNQQYLSTLPFLNFILRIAIT